MSLVQPCLPSAISHHLTCPPNEAAWGALGHLIWGQVKGRRQLGTVRCFRASHRVESLMPSLGTDQTSVSRDI